MVVEREEQNFSSACLIQRIDFLPRMFCRSLWAPVPSPQSPLTWFLKNISVHDDILFDAEIEQSDLCSFRGVEAVRCCHVGGK